MRAGVWRDWVREGGSSVLTSHCRSIVSTLEVTDKTISNESDYLNFVTCDEFIDYENDFYCLNDYLNYITI